MDKKDPRIDTIIAKSADFAKPILTHLRKQIHAACPDAQETLKWGMPHFEYKGILAFMAPFKAHCAFGFWKGDLIFGKSAAEQAAMGQFGRLTSVKDLPSDKVLAKYVKLAMKLNDEGVPAPSRSKSKSIPKALVIPPYFKAAVRKNKKASANFEGFTYGKQKDYVEWISGAKTEATRERRLKTAIEWMEEGKSMSWKYEKK